MQVAIPKEPKKAQAETADRLAVSVREAAALLSVSEQSVRKLAKRGDIQSRRIGSRIVFPVASIEAFLHAPAGGEE